LRTGLRRRFENLRTFPWPEWGPPQESVDKLSEEFEQVSEAEYQSMFCRGEREREREMQHAKSNSLDGQDEKLAFSLVRHYGIQETIRFRK